MTPCLRGILYRKIGLELASFILFPSHLNSCAYGYLLKDHNPKKEALVKDRTPPLFFLLRRPLNGK